MTIYKGQDKVIKAGLYSQEQFFIASVIGGPVIAGSIIALNLWASGKS